MPDQFTQSLYYLMTLIHSLKRFLQVETLRMTSPTSYACECNNECGIPLEITTNVSNFIGCKFLKIYNQNHLEIRGLTTTTDPSTVLTAVLQSIPVGNVVSVARSCHLRVMFVQLGSASVDQSSYG